MADPDADIRLAAFHHLRGALRAQGGPLPWSVIRQGFIARGRHFLFATAAEGIFRPAGMSGILSVKTVVPKPKGRVWYHDQVAPELAEAADTLSYAFTGSNPEHSRNRWVKQAMLRQLPIIYFFGVAPGIYEPLFPTFVTEWEPEELRCRLSFSDAKGDDLLKPLNQGEKRYALRTVQQRLHQAVFRERVLAAYGHRCALCGLPELRLIDAAHIIPDEEDLGTPDVCNGICMSKIHHAAYDAGLIGIDADLTVHVSERLLIMHDGPLLELALKALAGKKVRAPSDPLALPDRDRLALRFERFRASG